MTSRGSFALMISMAHAFSIRFGFIDFDVIGQLPKNFHEVDVPSVYKEGKGYTSLSSNIFMMETTYNLFSVNWF